MGVRVVGWSRLELTPLHDRSEQECFEDHIWAFAYPGFEQSARGLADHDKVSDDGGMIGGRCYAVTSETDRSEILEMSYGGYNEWRELLAGAVLGVDPEVVWADLDTWRDRPFFEVINFGDNEGCIGPEAGADLLADFHDPQHRAAYEKAIAGRRDERWLLPLWDAWIKGLELATDRGLVRYS